MPSVEYYKMRALFYKLCEQDATCVPKLNTWKAKEVTWAPPMEAAYCTHVISGNGFTVDAAHPFPGGKSLKELLTSSVYLPAKESWAPFKTWIQTVCHKTKKCGNDIGKWSDNLDKIEKQADR